MATILDLPEVRRRMRLWTVAEYEKLGDDPAFRRTELIRGIIFNKTAKTPLYCRITSGLYDFFRGALRPEFIVRQYDPLRLVDSMPEPAIAVVHGVWEDFSEQHPFTAELVVEVATDNAVMDREKVSLYAEAGIAEYWIVLAERKAVEVYRRPKDGSYLERLTYRRGETIPEVAVLGGAGMPVDAWFAHPASE